jgi:hypothetical protein
MVMVILTSYSTSRRRRRASSVGTPPRSSLEKPLTGRRSRGLIPLKRRDVNRAGRRNGPQSLRAFQRCEIGEIGEIGNVAAFVALATWVGLRTRSPAMLR